LVLPGDKIRQLPSWRRVAEIAVLLILVFGVIAAFASERVGSPSNPPPTSQGNLGIYPPSFATPNPGGVSQTERDLGVLWKITDTDPAVPLVDVSTFMGTTFFMKQDEVLSVESASGAINWRTSIPHGWGLLADSQGIYVTTSTSADDVGPSNLLKLSYQTGEQVWTAPVGLYPGKPILGEGIIYVWNTANQLHAISAGGGTELWSEDYSHTPLSTLSVQNAVDSSGRSPAAILDGENLIVGTSDARVGSIHISGSENHDWNWSAQLEFTNMPGFELAVAGDSVAAIAITTMDMEFSGQLTVWDRTTGEELWAGDETKDYRSVISTGTSFAIAVYSRSSAATPPAQQNVFEASSSYTTTAFDPSSGAELWSEVELRPTFYDRANSLLFAMTNNVWTAALNPETGEVLGSAYPSGFLGTQLSADTHAVYGQRWGGALVAVDINAFKNGTLEGGEIPGSTPEAIQSPESDSALLWQTEPVENVRSVGPEA
ncbi:MAG: PQQ-binding-like beta-propeller repeat protein, partial [Thermomicrobiales bacterium]